MPNIYKDIRSLEDKLRDDYRAASSKPTSQQNKEYIDRLLETIRNLDKLAVYY